MDMLLRTKARVAVAWVFICLALPGPGMAEDATEYLEQENSAIWYSCKWTGFDVPNALDDIHAASKGANIPAVTSAHEMEFRAGIGSLVRALRAATFAEFCRAVREISPGPIQLSAAGRSIILFRAEQLSLIEAGSSLEDVKLLERYWTQFTRFGEGAKYFIGYAPGDSDYRFFRVEPAKIKLLTTGNYTARLAVTAEHSGIAGSPVLLHYGDAIDNYAESNQVLEVAVLRLTLRTSVRGIAYPIVVRYFWSPSKKRWLPFDEFELYKGPRLLLIY